MGVIVSEKVKGSGVWWVFVNHKGKRASKRVGTKEAAKAAAVKVEKEIALERFGIESPGEIIIPLFKIYAEKWYRTHVEHNLKPASKRSYRDILDRHLLPTFGEKSLSDISRADVKEFAYTLLGKGMGPSSTKTTLIVLSSIYNHVVEDGILTSNPASRIGKFLKVPSRRGKAEFLTPEECNALLEAARMHTPRYYPLFLAAIRTGMRQGELIGLKWEDVDSRGGFIEVRRTNYMGYISSPKNGRTRRVDMSDGLRDALTYHKKMLAVEALSLGRPMSEWIFPSEDGSHLWATNLRKRFGKCLTKAGLRHVPFHALRHTYASALLGMGESPAYVQAQLGHASISMTVDTYGHLIPGTNRQAVNRLDDLLWNSRKTAPQAHPLEGASA